MKIYVNVYNCNVIDGAGNHSPDYDGKVAFKTPAKALETAALTGRHVRTDERTVSAAEFKQFIPDWEWDNA